MSSIKWFLILFLLPSITFSMELAEGFSRNSESSSLFKLIYQRYKTRPGYLYEYSTGRFYTLSKNGSAIGNYDLNDENDKPKGWPLTPWPNHLFLAGEYDASTEAGSAARGQEFTRPSDPVQVVTDRTANYYNHTNYQLPGCLNKTPLRYGDVDENNTPELVITPDSTIIFFSPQQGKVIFSYHYQLNDEMSKEQAELVFLPPYIDENPQYIAGSGQDELVRRMFPAQRSLSKIYIQDFNGDKNPDLILWRKMYRSNLRNNPTEGFHLLAESWTHYQLTNGEYLPQDTAPETIQNWLTSANLTWSKGFPSLSECAGEEGKLIPEMHDPLLNDPDVLK